MADPVIGNDILREAVVEAVLWCEHDHSPRPCCLDAMLAAIPEGWAKIDGEWVYFSAASPRVDEQQRND